MNETRNTRVDRRSFLKSTGAAAAFTGMAAALPADDEAADVIPQRPLGSTGVDVPIIGLGTAPAGFRSRQEAATFYELCLDEGVTYVDTAPEFAGYGQAQVALGDVLKTRRDDAFVVTKCWEPDGEKALALLRKNLSELQTDHADVVYAHSIGSDRMDLSTVLGRNGVMRALEKAQRDGLARFIGITGHNRPEKCLKVLREFDVQVMMNGVSYVSRHIYDFETKVWPEAHEQGVALVAMKVYGGMVGQRRKSRVVSEDLRHAFRYAQGLPNVATVVLGMRDRRELQQNIAWARDYQPLTEEEYDSLLRRGQELATEWGEVYGPVV